MLKISFLRQNENATKVIETSHHLCTHRHPLYLSLLSLVERSGHSKRLHTYRGSQVD